MASHQATHGPVFLRANFLFGGVKGKLTRTITRLFYVTLSSSSFFLGGIGPPKQPNTPTNRPTDRPTIRPTHRLTNRPAPPTQDFGSFTMIICSSQLFVACKYLVLCCCSYSCVCFVLFCLFVRRTDRFFTENTGPPFSIGLTSCPKDSVHSIWSILDSKYPAFFQGMMSTLCKKRGIYNGKPIGFPKNTN